MAKSKSKKAKEVKLKKIPLPLALNIFLGVVLGLIASILVIFLILTALFADRIYPGISIANIDVSGLTQSQAQQKLQNKLISRLGKEISFSPPPTSTSSKLTLNLNNLESKLQTQKAIAQAFELGHIKVYLPITNFNLELSSPEVLDQKIEEIAKQVDKVALESEIKLSGNEINVTPSQEGFIVDPPQFKNQLLTFINTGQAPTNLPMVKDLPKLPYDQALILKKRLDQIKLEPLKLIADQDSFKLDLATLLPLLDLQNQPSYLDQKKASDYIQKLASQIDKGVQEPLFAFDPTSPNKVKEFSAPVPGKKLDQTKTFELLSQSLRDSEQKEIQLPVETINPKNKLTNDLGIKEQIGLGVSNFDGSIDNRIFNLKLAASRLNGVLVGPGETFSFLNTVGDISEATGYKKAYVIKSGRTVLDDGGGVCQISTTLFRAVLNAGLPITDRTAHAYRVHYYENGGYPPGLDATIYSPGVDFKFKNDTPGHILIQAATSGLNLYVNLYGTSDGRVATLTKPLVTNITPAPPDLRQDDPSLPKGTVKQVDWAVSGANVSFKRTVTRDGQTLINETYRSNYRPWQAVYLVGTKEG